MALITCKECGRELSNKAKACPHCGFKPKRIGFLTWFVILVFGPPAFFGVLGALFGLIPSGSPSPQRKALEKVETPEQTKASQLAAAAERQRKLDKSRESYAIILAEQAITKRLKAPSTADFSSILDTRIGHLSGGGPNKWVVKGYVDSQNGFGAMLRSNYQVVIEFKEGEYDNSRILSVDLD
jgi:hypothetical protein